MPVAVIGPNGGLYNSSSTISVDENTSFVFDFDSDQSVTWSIVGQGGGFNPDKFNINSSSGILSFNIAPDYENPGSYDNSNYYGIYIKATSVANGETAFQWVGITVRDVPESAPTPAPSPTPTPTPSPTPTPAPSPTPTPDSTPPGIQGPQGGLRNSTSWITIQENTSDIFQFTSDETVTWSISGGQDSSKFNINPSSGRLYFQAPPDFENPSDYPDSGKPDNVYGVSIKATDAAGNSSFQFLLVTVSDVAEIVTPTQPPKASDTGPSQSPRPETNNSETKSTNPSTKAGTFDVEEQSTVQRLALNEPIALEDKVISDAIIGTNGNDLITGSDQSEALFGGTGRDQLTGGGGADAFVFDSYTDFGNKRLDAITDFSRTEGDIITLSSVAFKLNSNSKAVFVSNKSSLRLQAKSSSSIIYDSSSGTLYYDANGKSRGFGDGGPFAHLLGEPPLVKLDFTII